MAWQVIGISNPAQLSVKDNQLVITQEDSVYIPIEDIDALVIDTHGLTLTTNLITELTNQNTTVVVCDARHLPASVLLPYSQHSRQAKVSRQQLAMGATLKKQLWARIIMQKIINQADVLAIYGYDNAQLNALAGDVKSGDTTNRESVAARLYFAALLDDATRRKPLWHNAALNYGYAMVRSHIARHIAARGLIASQGIFHRSELNSFNLADDIIEPYRALIDNYVLSVVQPRHIGDPDASLTKDDRQLLVNVLNETVLLAGKKYTLKHAVERTVESFIQAIQEDSATQLTLPELNQR